MKYLLVIPALVGVALCIFSAGVFLAWVFGIATISLNLGSRALVGFGVGASILMFVGLIYQQVKL